MTAKGPRWTGKLRFVEEHLLDPQRWTKPRRIFVNSMSDLFHEKIEKGWLDAIFRVMVTVPRHTFQILTKRPHLMRQYLSGWSEWVEQFGWPTADRKVNHIWVGTSVESADEVWRIDELRETPATIRFLSLEPLIGPLDGLDLRGISWLIIGGESGPHARPMRLEWVRSILDQAREAGVKPFVKQLGSLAAKEAGLRSKGGEMETWPEDLRIREFPGVPA
jgi:protein gp37